MLVGNASGNDLDADAVGQFLHDIREPILMGLGGFLGGRASASLVHISTKPAVLVKII